MSKWLLVACALPLFPFSVVQGQEDPERFAMADRALAWPQLIEFHRVEPRWLEGQDVFRYRTRRGGVLIVDCESGEVDADGDPSWPTVPSPDDVPTPSPSGPVQSTAGTALVRDGALRLQTEDGERELAGGEPESAWQLADDSWSPDGRFLAAVRIDARDLFHIPVEDYREPIPPLTLAPYPKTGDTFPRAQLAVFDVTEGVERSIDLGEDDIYVMVEGWRHGGRELLVHRTSRDAQRTDLLAVDPASGAVRTILTETSATFIGGLEYFIGAWRDVYVPIADGEQFVWRSERNGWAHLYLYDAEGTLLRRLTEGELPVERVAAVDEEGGAVYYYAPAPARPYDRHLWCAPLGGGEPEQLTHAPGRHEVSLAPSFRYFVDTHSSLDRPPASEVRSCADALGTPLAEADISALEDVGLFPGEPFVAMATDGETELHGVIYVPWDFDPEKRYPVIDYIYAGPFLSVVQHDYAGDYMTNTARALAQLGYVVFMVDARGTPGRSKAFQDANYGIIGQVVAHDHAAVLREIAAARPYMDTDRVGIVGGSWGGYFVVKAMFTEPETFHVGVASAPGDLTEHATINEPNMGLPARNPEGYRIGSITFGARNLTGKLMLAHGTSDVNAPISTSMRVASALIEAGKDFEFLVIPGQGHGFTGASQRWFERRRARFLREHLGVAE